MEDKIRSILQKSAELKSAIASDKQLIAQVNSAANILIQTVRNGGTIFSCGNGGSTCDAMHLTEELVARFKKDRPGIRAVHLMDPSILTCWSNDYNFESVFERQVSTFCTAKDTLIGFSTSGRSKNVISAIKAAKKIGCRTIALTGKDGGEVKPIADLSIIVPSNETERIQEVHITLVHIFAEALEELFS